MTKKKLSKYVNRVAIAISVLLNVILLGSSNQTFSARNYLLKKRGKPNMVWLIDRIIFWDDDHCFYSYIYWITGKNIRKVGNNNTLSLDKPYGTVYIDNEINIGENDASFD
jgi:hypothetical protein